MLSKGDSAEEQLRIPSQSLKSTTLAAAKPNDAF